MENYLMHQVCVLQFLFVFQNTYCFPVNLAGVLWALRVEKDLALLRYVPAEAAVDTTVGS